MKWIEMDRRENGQVKLDLDFIRFIFSSSNF